MLCEEMICLTPLLFHTGIHQFSCGKILIWLAELKTEEEIFLWERKSNLAEVFDVTIGWQNLLISVTFSTLNELNLSLQGQLWNVFVMHGKIKAFKRKLSIWSKRTDIGIYIMSPQCCQIVIHKHIVT
jgi:hypothetical protein